jgi:hypothetical protein
LDLPPLSTAKLAGQLPMLSLITATDSFSEVFFTVTKDGHVHTNPPASKWYSFTQPLVAGCAFVSGEMRTLNMHSADDR